MEFAESKTQEAESLLPQFSSQTAQVSCQSSPQVAPSALSNLRQSSLLLLILSGNFRLFLISHALKSFRAVFLPRRWTAEHERWHRYIPAASTLKPESSFAQEPAVLLTALIKGAKSPKFRLPTGLECPVQQWGFSQLGWHGTLAKRPAYCLCASKSNLWPILGF